MKKKEEINQILQQLSEFDMKKDDIDLQSISDLIELLFIKNDNEDLGDLISDSVSKGLLTLEQGAMILNISRWCGNTNGSQLTQTLEDWLEKGIDLIKIKLALAQDIFLFTSNEKMKYSLLKILELFPELENHIKEKIEKRKSLGY